MSYSGRFTATGSFRLPSLHLGIDEFTAVSGNRVAIWAHHHAPVEGGNL